MHCKHSQPNWWSCFLNSHVFWLFAYAFLSCAALSSLSHCRKWDIRRHKPWLCREGWLFKAFLMTEPVLGFNRQFCWSALHTLHSSLFLCFIFLASIIVENDICCVGLNMLPMSAFALSPARIILLGTLMLQRLCCYKPWCSLCNIIAYVL